METHLKATERSVTCHMESHNVTRHSNRKTRRRNSSQTRRYSIYLSHGDSRLSWRVSSTNSLRRFINIRCVRKKVTPRHCTIKMSNLNESEQNFVHFYPYKLLKRAPNFFEKYLFLAELCTGKCINYHDTSSLSCDKNTLQYSETVHTVLKYYTQYDIG